MKVKQFVVLGLGSFGRTLALRLSKNGCRVTGVDLNERNVEAIQDKIHEAIVADVTDRGVLEQLMLDQADGVFVSLGEEIERSILACLHAKELKAREVYVKGVSPEHGRILEKLEVTRVIYPEMEIAELTADQLTMHNVLDVFQIDPEYAIVETVAPPSLVGRTLADAALPRTHGLFVVGVKEALADKWNLMPHADHRFTDEQFVLLLGRREDLDRFCKQD